MSNSNSDGDAKQRKQGSMAFSFADFGFWRLAVVSFVLDLLHLMLESHWPAIQASRLGPRPTAARYFMLLEAVALFVALAAAIGSVSRMLKGAPRRTGQMAAVVLTAVGLLGVFLFVWQR
jgi:hypothetical protein